MKIVPSFCLLIGIFLVLPPFFLRCTDESVSKQNESTIINQDSLFYETFVAQLKRSDPKTFDSFLNKKWVGDFPFSFGSNSYDFASTDTIVHTIEMTNPNYGNLDTSDGGGLFGSMSITEYETFPDTHFFSFVSTSVKNRFQSTCFNGDQMYPFGLMLQPNYDSREVRFKTYFDQSFDGNSLGNFSIDYILWENGDLVGTITGSLYGGNWNGFEGKWSIDADGILTMDVLHGTSVLLDKAEYFFDGTCLGLKWMLQVDPN